MLVACASSAPPPVHAPPRAAPWAVPAGWKHELIPFPLGFAPGLPHTGVEELRFAPGFSKPTAPGYWSYAFLWRLERADAFDATSVGAELTTYFRGLVDAVDEKNAIADHGSIAVTASPAGDHLVLSAHMLDAFATKLPLDLVGTARQIACSRGAVWVFVLTPAASAMRAEVTALAATAACDQPTVPNDAQP